MTQQTGKIGTPYHGRLDAAGQMTLPNASVIAWPNRGTNYYGGSAVSVTYTAIKLQAPDAPAAPSTSAAETLAGKEWRNYLLYQAGGGDIYSLPSTTIDADPSAEGIKAIWLYTPKFGLTFRMRLLMDAFGYYLWADRVGEMNADSGPTITFVHESVRADYLVFADVVDGAGDKVMFMTTDLLTVPTQYQSVIEWALSYNDATGDIALVENTVDSSPTTASQSNDSSKIPRTSWSDEIISSEIHTCTLDGVEKNVTLNTIQRISFTVDPGDSKPFEFVKTDTGDDDIINFTQITNNNTLLWAIYENGVGKSIRFVSSLTQISETLVQRTIQGLKHDEPGPVCGGKVVVIDTEFKKEAFFSSDSSQFSTKNLIVGGIVIKSGTTSSNRHREKTFEDGILDFRTVFFTGWDVDNFTSSGNGLQVQLIALTHPMLTVETDSFEVLHPYGLTPANESLILSLDVAAGAISQESFIHGWA